MKKFRFLAVIALVFSLVLLAGCSSFNSVKSDFEKADYKYSEKVNDLVKPLLAEFEEDDVKVTPHVFTKGLNVAVVLEFQSTKELNKQLEESSTLKGLVKDLQKSELVRGNCLLIPIGLNPTEMVNAFNGNAAKK